MKNAKDTVLRVLLLLAMWIIGCIVIFSILAVFWPVNETGNFTSSLLFLLLVIIFSTVFAIFTSAKIMEKYRLKHLEHFTLFRSPKDADNTFILKEKTLEQRNAEYLAMRELEIVRLNSAYDFNSLEGIESIPVPCKEVNGDSPTGRVEYYLKGHCFVKHRDSGNIDLAVACLKKAQALMFISDMIWKRSDFMPLVKYLHEIGRHREADIELEKIEQFFAFQEDNITRQSNKALFDSLSRLETDLVIVEDSGVCCAKCAMYRNRVYSMTGNDKRFPQFPNDFHYKCGISPTPFILGVSEPSFECKNIIKYSNRPFVDDRTQEEVHRYNNWHALMVETEEKENKKAQAQKEYFWLQENLPDMCPKSLSGYSRMKNANTENFQKIAQEAAKLGKNLL